VLPTCADVTGAADDALSKAKTYADQIAKGLQPRLLDCNGKALASDTRMATCDDLENMKPSGDFQPQLLDCDGNPLAANSKVASCSDIGALQATLPRAASAPAASTGTGLPTGVIGGRTLLLGEPAGWVEYPAGTGQIIPYFHKP
jgi:hypothetical protein